ncbi:hypothetical protein L1887_52448 [Cichorium endivia]|nr:hypothetical protein L1887_52448 [Cichorium endivia]
MVNAVIAIHGGAGAITRAQLSPEQEKRYIDALYAIVETGQRMLEAGESALDVVTEAVRLLKSARYLMQGSRRLPSGTGWNRVSPDLFSTEERYQQLLEARSAGMTQLDHSAPLDETTKMGTVGAVALDKAGNLAAATSTGGMTNKLPGRVGDSPLPGCRLLCQ